MHKIIPKCLVCGEDKIAFEEPVKRVCNLCGFSFEADTTCSQEHYVCHDCRQKDARTHIISYCLQSSETDLFLLINQLMQLPSILMHGPEHHLLLAAALLTVYSNQTQQFPLEEKLAEANQRSLQVPGGACGNWGVCGASIGAGIYASIMTEASPFSEDEWKITGQLAARCADAISKQGGPRCCKRDTFIAMTETVPYSNEQFGTTFALPGTIQCEYFVNNQECKGRACPYFPTKKQSA